ncbi:MAG: hypothetical protein ACI9SV_000331 [Aquiluna sp.]
MPDLDETIFGPEAKQLLGKLGFLDAKADLLKLTTDLRKQGHEPRLVALCISQAKLRSRAVSKFGSSLASTMLFTEEGLEQATRQQVAAWHAQKFLTHGIKTVTDLGCGIGADALAFAQAGLEVTAIEKDELTANIAKYNLNNYPMATVSNADALDIEPESPSFWLDPARRKLSSKAAGRVMLKPEDFSPNLNFAFEIGARHTAGIKLAGSLPHELIPEDCEANWVSHNNELVETVLWFGELGQSGKRSALILADTITEYSGDLIQAPISEVGKFVYDPNPALVRSHLLGAFAVENGLWGIAPSIAYLSSDSEISSPWLRGFEVVESLPLDVKRIAKRMSELDIGTLEIKKRGVDITPEQLRPKLKLKGRNAATLILTRVGDARKALVCQPLS